MKDQATVYTIIKKRRTEPLLYAQMSDFRYKKEGRIAAESILSNPALSLYCLHDTAREAVFIESSQLGDMHTAPFMYQRQFKRAKRLIVVSYETLHRLAERCRTRKSKIIFLHSIGRCGSTLLHTLFNEIPGMKSFSEPDVFTHMIEMREPDGSRDQEIIRLIKSIITLKCHSPYIQDIDTVVFKLRNFCIEIGDMLHAAVPDAHNIFLYRNAEDWARSSARAFKIFDVKTAFIVFQKRHVWNRFVSLYDTYAAKHGKRFNVIKYTTLLWVSFMNCYRRFVARGIPFLALRYEDLIKQPQYLLNEIFTACKISGKTLGNVNQRFNQDSQQNTVLAKQVVNLDENNFLRPRHIKQLRRIIANDDTINSPHYVLPNTIMLPSDDETETPKAEPAKLTG